MAAADRQPAQQRPAPRRRGGISARPHRPRHRRQAAARTAAPGPRRATPCRPPAAWSRSSATATWAIDCTDQVHPEVAHAAVLAARVVGLDIAGIDLVAAGHRQPAGGAGRRHRRSQRRPGPADAPEAGGRLAAPGGPRHLRPPVPRRRRPPAAFPSSAWPARSDTAALARLVAWLIGLGGRHTGLACRDGLFLDRRRVDARDSAHWDAGHRLLINRAVQAVVIENGADSHPARRPGLRPLRGRHRDRPGRRRRRWPSSTSATSDQMVQGAAHPGRRGAARRHRRAQRGRRRAWPRMAPLCDGEVILYAADAQRRRAGARTGRPAAGPCWCGRTAWCWPPAAASRSCPASAG